MVEKLEQDPAPEPEAPATDDAPPAAPDAADALDEQTSEGGGTTAPAPDLGDAGSEADPL